MSMYYVLSLLVLCVWASDTSDPFTLSGIAYISEIDNGPVENEFIEVTVVNNALNESLRVHVYTTYDETMHEEWGVELPPTANVTHFLLLHGNTSIAGDATATVRLVVPDNASRSSSKRSDPVEEEPAAEGELDLSTREKKRLERITAQNGFATVGPRVSLFKYPTDVHGLGESACVVLVRTANTSDVLAGLSFGTLENTWPCYNNSKIATTPTHENVSYASISYFSTNNSVGICAPSPGQPNCPAEVIDKGPIEGAIASAVALGILIVSMCTVCWVYAILHRKEYLEKQDKAQHAAAKHSLIAKKRKNKTVVVAMEHV